MTNNKVALVTGEAQDRFKIAERLVEDDQVAVVDFNRRGKSSCT